MITYLETNIPSTRMPISEIFDAAEEKNAVPAAFTSGEEMRDFYSQVLGIESVTVHNGEENDLITPLFDNLFILEEHIDPEEIGLIIIIDDEVSKGDRMVNLGQYLQQRYELENADVLVLSGNHCSNFEYAIWYAEKIANSPDQINVVILGVTYMVRKEQRIISSYAIMGDAAAVCVVRPDSQENGLVKVVQKHSITNGSMYKAIMSNDNTLMLFKYYLKTISGLLKKSGMKADQFTHFLLQNANPEVTVECALNSGFKREQIYQDNLTKYGHLDCIDFILNLKDVTASAASGDKFFSFGTGWAGSFICLQLEKM